MKKQGFTVAVVDEGGLVRSGIWKFKASKQGDLMIGNSSMGQFKYTLHAPRGGQFGCHIAWEKAHIPDGFEGRALNRWERRTPAEGKANAVFSINFPGSYLATPFAPPKPVDVALPVPSPGRVAQFIVMFSLQPLPPESFPPGLVPHGDHVLASGEHVHFISREQEFPDAYALELVEHLYPERNFSGFPPDQESRLTLHPDPDPNDCVNALEVGGPNLRKLLKQRWGL